MMERLTPLVQPLSIDEAVLDLAGTEALHGAPPAAVLARFARDVERRWASPSRSASRPTGCWPRSPPDATSRAGFASSAPRRRRCWRPSRCACCRAWARRSPAGWRRWASPGSATCRRWTTAPRGPASASDGPALVRRARGEDTRRVDPARETKSISAETTFETDISDRAELERQLWRMAGKAGPPAARAGFCRRRRDAEAEDRRVCLRTRAHRLAAPTVLPDLLFAAARTYAGPRGRRHRFPPDRHRRPAAAAAGELADQPDLADPRSPRRVAAQAAIDALRARFGAGVVIRGRGL